MEHSVNSELISYTYFIHIFSFSFFPRCFLARDLSFVTPANDNTTLAIRDLCSLKFSTGAMSTD